MENYYIPRLKLLVEFCSINNKIYFFSKPSIAVTMEDSSGFIATVCKSMDGKKDLKQLTELLLPQFPSETPYINNLLTALDNEHLLEDVSCNPTNSLTNYDITRWSRNIEFFSAHCKAKENKHSYQEKLKSIKVTILGLGGVGSNVLYNLAALGVCNIKAIDCDKVELSNLNRQIIYKESDIGQLKSIAAKNRILEFIPHANIEFINKEIKSSLDIKKIISNQDIVINAIDHPREKIMDWLNIACVKQNIPFLCGSLDSRLITCYSIIPGKTGCIECWKNSASKSKPLFQKLIQEENFVASTSPNVAIMPFISICSGLIANEFLKIITEIAEPQSLGCLYTFDFISSQTTISENWKKNADCPVCQMDPA